ncbi:MAG: NIPSNAP family protein [Acidimicrobiia bacterium]
MLIEIRRYTLEPGRRAEFVRWFENEVRPAMEAAGIAILGSFESVDDPDAFVYMRGFDNEQQRGRLTAAFHSGEVWLGGMRERALEMEVGYEVEVVRSTPGSAI